MKKVLLSIVLLCSGLFAWAQTRQVSGVITDQADGTGISGVNVVVKGGAGTITDKDGKFVLSVEANATTLVISFVGYATQEIPIPESNAVNVQLAASAQELTEVIVSVGRGAERTLTDTPLPVDVLSYKELASTGQPSFDKALQYRVPSFNTVNTPVNDATSLLDPYELRNLGPSRTLILINGKRKNLSSLVYTQTSPGRGETGADLSAIPEDAIKRVEILRDGASAQYGSDAIAGVMNIILKDRFDASSIRLTTGVTSKGDGLNYGVNYNSGANIGDKGYINYHISFLRQERIIRSGKVDPVAEVDPVFGFGDGTPQTTQTIQNFLKRFPDGRNVNGTTDNTSAKFLINFAVPLNKNTEFYGNAAYVYRKALSYANYRQPYWKKDYGLLHTPDPSGTDYTGSTTPADIALYKGYLGYQPTFEGDLNDYNATLGLRTRSENGWKQDMSLTVGGNKMLFTVNNTVNHSLAFQSPVSFKPGGFSFNHFVGNIDVSKSIGKKLFFGFGTEFRSETYKEIAGDTASYSGGGANSFPGFPAKNAITASRFNIGGYVDIGLDIFENWFIGATGRAEKYSDFDNAFVGKFSTRVKFWDDKITLRSSISNGFRAPTLHQYNLSLNQASFSSGNIVIQGLANNYSREAAVLGIPKLRPEKSINFTAGFGFNPVPNLSLTFDYYYIDITDRILFSALVKTGISTKLDSLLALAQSTGVSFFINGAHTQTEGLDLVASYRNLKLGDLTLNLNLAGNYVLNNKLIGKYQTPPAIDLFGGQIFTKTEEALMLTSRPKYKFILGTEFVVSKFNFNLNNTLLGPAYYSNVAYADFGQLDNLQTAFDPRVLTDLAIGYAINKHVNVSLAVANIFNVYPKYKIKALNAAGSAFLGDTSSGGKVQNNLLVGDLTFNGRYPYQTYDGAHMNQVGTTFLAQLLYKF